MPTPPHSAPCRAAVRSHRCLRFGGGVFLALAWLAFSAAQAQTTNFALGAPSLLVGPVAGTNSVVLAVTPQTAAWTNSANDAWLHLSLPNQSGVGSTNVVFTYDANPGATRTGTLALASQTLTVTQAGSTYVAAEPLSTLVPLGLNAPYGVAADRTGNVYIADSGNNAILQWTAASNTVSLVVYSGSYYPQAVAVDGAGNVFFADSGSSSINEWSAANSNVTTLVSSGLSFPGGVAVDGAGNVYIADTFNSAIKEWTAATSNVTTLVSSGLDYPYGVAVDGAGNVYIADTGNNAIKAWSPANSNVTTLVASGLNVPQGLAVDGAGNVFVADTYNSAIKKWTAANGNVTALVSSGLSYPIGVTLDGTGNLYIAETDNNAIKELPYAFVDPTARAESAAAGNDALPVVLPATENLQAQFAPSSDQPWLAISGATNGVVGFSFLANTGATRTAHITVLGHVTPVTQGPPTFTIGTNSLLEGLNAGSDSVVLTVIPEIATWTATANAAWLHLTVANQSGVGSTNVVFTFDQNPGATRIGTLTIAGQTLTVTQTGPTYSLGTNALGEGVNAGSDSVVLTVSPNFGVWTATANATWLHLSLANQSGTGSASVAFSFDANPGATRIGTLTIAGQTLTVTQASPAYSLATNALSEWATAGSDSVLLTVNPNFGVWTATANATWLHLSTPNQSGTGSTNVVFTFDANPGAIRIGTLTIGGQTLTVTQANVGLGTKSLLEGPMAGSDSVVLAVNPGFGVWTATTNANWLHLSAANQSGAASTNVVFSFDSNPGPIRLGTLTIAGLTLTVTQAGSTYVAAQPLTTLVSSGLNGPADVAVDGAGNVYIADFGNNAIKKWTAASNTVSTVVSSGLSQPIGVAVDRAGNVYIADTSDNAIKEWTAANSTVTTLVSSGVSGPHGVALDGAGNVFIAVYGNNAIKEWTVANSNLATLVSSGVSSPAGVALDATGNVYIADFGNNAIKEWTAANSNLTTLVSSGLSQPFEVALDGAGNVFFTDSANNALKKRTAANNTVTSLISTGLSYPVGVAVDGTGNIYFADSHNNAIKELPHAFVDPTPRLETLAAGNDALPVILPATENLLAPFAPTTDQSWLTITGVTNGVVSFAFTATAANRTGNILLLGQTIPITQGGPNYSLGATNLLVGPGAGSNSVVLAVVPNFAMWTAMTNATWLHLTAANQSGTGSTNVIFSFDANPGPTRSGTLTIAGLTLTVTQAGSTYVAAGTVTTLASAGLSYPFGVALDGVGSLYLADSHNNAIKKWTPANNTLSTIVPSGLNLPRDVALDGAGNVYIADTLNSAVKEWTAASNTVTTLVSSGLSSPCAVALDAATNVYIADYGTVAVYKWTVATKTLTTLVSTGLGQPIGVALDAAGNVYIGDNNNNSIEKWSVDSKNLTTLVSLGSSGPNGVAVDGAGNVYVADYGDYTIKRWTAANSTVTTLVSSGLYHPSSVAVDGTGNVYIADAYNNLIKELPQVFMDTTPKLETLAAGNDALPVILPATENLLAPFAPTTDQSWLTITGVTNGVVSFAFTATAANRTGNILLLGQTIPITQGGPSISLGATNLLVGPGAGSNSVVLAVVPNFAMWTATANTAWLHLTAANQSGTGSTNVIFSFDANPGPTRSGTLTIAGLTLTVTQAGSTYVAAGTVTTLVSSASGWNQSFGAAVDGAGNVYVGNYNNAVYKWTASNNSQSTVVSTGLNGTRGVAVDGAGNIYIADTGNSAVKEWMAAGNTVTTLVSAGLTSPCSVALDSATNVYIADYANVAVYKWTVASKTLTTLASSASGLGQPIGVAVDAAGNVYIGDFNNNAVEKWTAANGNLSSLISSGLGYPNGVAVDGSGNIYITGYNASTIQKWTAANGRLTTLVSSGLSQPAAVAVDGTGNIYIADTHNNAVKELPQAFVDTTPKMEALAAGSDALPVVLPVTENLLAPFAPTSDQTWLTITGVANGVVTFSFSAATSIRTAHVTVLNQSIPVTQGSSTFSLGTTALWEGPAAGSDSVVLAVSPNFATWAANTNATWLHLTPANQSGTGSKNVVFTFDANSGQTRSATLAIAGQILTITQAGSTYIAARPVTALVSTGLSYPFGVAADGAGHVYIADNGNSAIKKWTAANNTVASLVSVGLNGPQGMAVDGAGHVFFADTANNAIKEWTAANSNVTTLVSTNLINPGGVAVDVTGNVYIADSGNNAIKEWTAANSNVITLVSANLSTPSGVAVDAAGNVYIADTLNSAIKEWTAANSNVTTLVSSGLSYPYAVAVDGAGNVYIADTLNSAIKEWTAANSNVITLISSGLSYPYAVAVDLTGNVYIADSLNNAIKELPRAFVDPTPRLESLVAGNDALPVVLPATENLFLPFAPGSDQSWLAISGVVNGVVGLSFTTNTGLSRTAHVTLLAQTISITQAGVTPPTLTGAQILGNGVLQFAFSNTAGASFSVLSATDLSLPTSNWTVAGAVTNMGSGLFQFTSQPATNDTQRFYRVRSP